MQYPDSLPLNDKEVVLIFDDGPSPRYSNEILDILASQTGQLRDLARELRSLGQYVFPNYATRRVVTKRLKLTNDPLEPSG